MLATPAMAQRQRRGQDAPPPPPPVPVEAPVAEAPVATVAPGAVSSVVRAVIVRGTERLEPETVRSYINLSIGDRYDRERLDQAVKALYASELFADATIRDDNGTLIVEVKENPVINRIVIEGGKRVKEDKIREEIRLAPRQIFTRSKARADVGRILELYRRSGRFAASIEPKIIQLEQNRVDVVFEIQEGPKSKVRQINILGNEKFSEKEIRSSMATKQARAWRFFTSNDTYDPDRLAYDAQKLRQFYLTEGYADFRVVSTVAELTPDKKDFIVTYVLDEGERYKFGKVELDSQIRDIKPKEFQSLIRVKAGDWYNAQKIEDTVESLTETAGLLGYAFADVRPQFDRDKEKHEMNVTFAIGEAPRVYVERIQINGNTTTLDTVIRREFRLAEGDAFNSIKVRRTSDRLKGLGYFQEKLEIEQKPGSSPDKVILEANVQERPTGELQVSAGFSSIERFILSLSIRQRNFRGRGQELRASANLSSYSKSIEAGFTEPYLFGRNLALGFDVFRRDFRSFRFTSNNTRDTTYTQVSTGFQVRTGFSITEFWAASLRYGLSREEIGLDELVFFTNGVCDPLLAGRYLCEAIGKRTISSIGYSIIYNNLNNNLRPSAGQRFTFSQDLAGVPIGVKYLRSRVNYDWYHNLFGSGFVLNIGGEAGAIFGYGGRDVLLTDRFFLGQPQMRGFNIRGVGPRVLRRPLDADGNIVTDRQQATDDALGGKAYYLARAEIQLPLGSAISELGLRPSIFTDVGAVWNVKAPQTVCLNGPTTTFAECAPYNGSSLGFREEFLGNTPSPRLSVGIGVNWNSPFGPFRFDLAKALLKQPGDDTQLFQFNVGTQF
ncbi:outer membrane protein assembly factor BamA [Polymorphobacter fuscus]|uniref:Outer membrane protein assembly factor BamA n=2 Tax=Sandarakinorhabdus fusca TaxID=1439888 RepID=A0A7C9GP96_9SPHN|nr:outer membrane protein assembly factor BamA [Polymorphobacter fuscus]KAB7649121.1 outer membrane protein assembly factor BamA [Polymorphobacter fuscus]MQT16550.1 outer membrane protein assembly factor BamA [Polymorphobacter fuscus]